MELVFVVVEDDPGYAIYDKDAKKFISTSKSSFDPPEDIERINVKPGDLFLATWYGKNIWCWHHLLKYMQIRF